MRLPADRSLTTVPCSSWTGILVVPGVVSVSVRLVLGLAECLEQALRIRWLGTVALELFRFDRLDVPLPNLVSSRPVPIHHRLTVTNHHLISSCTLISGM